MATFPIVKIRQANDSDTPQLAILFLITRQQTFKWENPEKFKLEDYAHSTLGETVFVAEDEDRNIVGFISVWDQDDMPFVHHLFVSPKYQRQGIGKQLVQSLFSWIEPPYRLKCVLKNEKALSFYQKHGWVEVERGIGEDGYYCLLELSTVPRKLI